MNTQKKLLAIVIVLGVMLVCLLGICAYQCLASVAAVRAITEQHDAMAHVKEQAAIWAQARADEKDVTAKVVQRHAPWSWNDQLPVMVGQLNDMVKDCGTVIDTLQPMPMVAREQLVRYPLHLTLHTHLANLTSLLKRVQGAAPLLAIDQLAIHAGKKPADPLLVDLTISSFVLLDSTQTMGGRS